jgi:pimeloyl-ACP methyl ester carboxylesterase
MPKKEKQKQLFNVGLGAGLLGALLLAFRYAIKRPTTAPVPDTISSKIFTTKVIHTSRGPMVYHESGSGQPLIFVHSICIGASSYEWSKIYPEFAAKHRVLALDLIGFGESIRPNAQLSAADYVRTLAEFIRATCWEQPPVLIGSGLGAGFCVYLASQHPELAQRLILLSPTGTADFGGQRVPFGVKIASRVPMLDRFLYRNYQSTRSAVQAWLAGPGFVDADKLSAEVVDVMTTCAQQYGAEHAILNLQRGHLNFDLDARMKMLALPVTLLWGDQCAHPPVEAAPKLQALVQNCGVIILKDAGAMAALESPEQVAEVLRAELPGELRVYKAV